MEKLIKKLKRYKVKSQKYRALYIKWLARERDAAKALQSAYYSDESTRNVALETLHEYGLSREVMEEDDDADEDKRD
jgi:hypothetical protein